MNKERGSLQRKGREKEIVKGKGKENVKEKGKGKENVKEQMLEFPGQGLDQFHQHPDQEEDQGHEN